MEYPKTVNACCAALGACLVTWLTGIGKIPFCFLFLGWYFYLSIDYKLDELRAEIAKLSQKRDDCDPRGMQ